MRLYGLYGIKGGPTSAPKPRSLIKSGLSPKKRDGGPPVPGYHAWFQARDRSDLIFDGDLIVGWRDRGPNRFVGVGQNLTSYVEGKGVSTTSTSAFDGGAVLVPNALNRIQHLFVAVGGWGNTYGGVLGHPSDQNFDLLTANDPSRFFTSWAGGSGIRINGVATNEMVENNNAVISSSTTNPHNNPEGGDTLQIGRHLGTSNRRTYYGGIGEIVLYQKVLSAGERNAVERWLAARWGILSKFP